MTSSQLDYVLKDYAEALNALEASASDITAAKALQVLLTRDEVEAALAKKEAIASENFLKLVELDRRLKANAELIHRTLQLEDCSASFSRRRDAWWWYLEKPNRPHPWDRYDWLWSALSLPFLTAALSLVTDISSRFLSGGPDTLGAFAVTTQSVLTLVAAGGALTKGGQHAIENILSSLNIPRHFQQETKLGLSVVLLIGLISFRSALPRIAEEYVDKGIRDWRNGKLTQALQEYNRALDLDPTNVRVHYHLGTLYEDMQEFDRARSEYRIAAQGGYEEAFNNLARLYILNKKPDVAASLLLNRLERPENGIDLSGLILDANLKDSVSVETFLQNKTVTQLRDIFEQSVHKYYMLKNLGWARLEQKRSAEAQANLQEALDLITAFNVLQQEATAEARPSSNQTILQENSIQQVFEKVNATRNGAAAHCLLAQATENLEGKKPAIVHWEACLQNAVRWNSDEDNWINTARQRLASEGE
jgi:tetratricopeptide (TPR) repeat protein